MKIPAHISMINAVVNVVLAAKVKSFLPSSIRT